MKKNERRTKELSFGGFSRSLDLSLNETKLTTRNAFIFNLFALESEKESKKTKEPFLGAAQPLVSERRLLAFVWITLILAIFQLLPVAFRKKRLISLNSALNFA